jgi:2'-5' RNA ligase/signal recognition particle receptor subunit beta
VRRGIEPAHSCGRQGVPTRAYMFAMLDNTFARAERFAALVAESRRRSCALVERADALRLAEQLAGETERDDADEPPLQLLAVLAELRDGHVRDARVGAAWARQLAAGEARATMWRLLYRWCVATANNAVPTMLEQFARFEPAEAFERQLHAGCAAALPFDRVLHMWLADDDADEADKNAVYVLLDDGVLRVDAATGAVGAPLPLDERRVRDDVLRVLLELVSWKGFASAGYGLLKRDWAVVRALRRDGEPALAAEVAPVADLRDAATTPLTALAMLVPLELAGAIQAVRALHDPAFARWPPHATLLFPFLDEPLALSDEVQRRLGAELRRLPPFRVTLADFDTFERSGTLFLTVQTEPRDALLAVYRTLAALFPACLKAAGAGQAFNAHVTVARDQDTFALERIAADLRRRRWQPVVFECRHIALLTRGADTPFAVARELPLDGGAPPPALDLGRPLVEAQHAEYKRALAGRAEAYRRWHRAPAPVTPLPAGVNAAHCVAASDSAAALSVVLIGDVDSGKSSMSGRLVAELGGLPAHVFKEYERVCRLLERPRALYAFVMDRLREERERQLSIEVHMWAVQALGTTIDLVDCPGHRRFLKNMATGASIADGALLMVSAAREEFERGIAAGVGMTRTEALVAHACGGVREFVVAVNKLDLFDDDARRARFDEVCESVARILAACGIDKPRTCSTFRWRRSTATTSSRRRPSARRGTPGRRWCRR